MLVDSSNSAASSSVTGAIRQAAQATGTSFNYLLATAQVESGLNALAGAATSSAKGLFQFIQQTWLATMKQAGPALGYGRYADAITKTASGQYEVSDPALRNEILNLRTDPAANAAMAGAFTQSNAAALSDRLGRSPSEGELYIAHFLGAGNAARLINLASSNPERQSRGHFSRGGAGQFADFLRPRHRYGPNRGAGPQYPDRPLRNGAEDPGAAGRDSANCPSRNDGRRNGADRPGHRGHHQRVCRGHSTAPGA